MKHILSFDIDEIGRNEFLEHCTKNPIDNKDKIISYMEKYMVPFTNILATSSCVVDIMSGTEIKLPDNGFTDGEYLWFTSELYHFKQYNLKLNDDFIDHVLKKVTV